jgi:putative membrane protein
MAIIFVGGHYGFSAVPGFEGGRDVPGSLGPRNEFDKFAHFFQGLVPAVLIRELLIRSDAIRVSRPLLPFVVAALALALSALYELCEWAVHLALGSRADSFIGAQSDPWDAQSDMAMALAGAWTATVLLARFHDSWIDAVMTSRRRESED